MHGSKSYLVLFAFAAEPKLLPLCWRLAVFVAPELRDCPLLLFLWRLVEDADDEV
jgi:hypothetical protein